MLSVPRSCLQACEVNTILNITVGSYCQVDPSPAQFQETCLLKTVEIT